MRPASLRRSISRSCLPLVESAEGRAGPAGLAVGARRNIWRVPSSWPSPAGPSILSTVAPIWARCRVASGPGNNLVRSSTVMPASRPASRFNGTPLHAATWWRPIFAGHHRRAAVQRLAARVRAS